MRVRIAILGVLVIALGLIVSLILRTRQPGPPQPRPTEILSNPGRLDAGTSAPPPSADPPPPARDTAPSPPPAAPGSTTSPKPSAPANPQPVEDQPPVPGSHRPKPDPRVAKTADGRTILRQPFDLSRQLHAPANSAQEDLDLLDQILRYYRKLYGQNPVVENDRAIIDALTGENPKQVVFFDPDHPSINADGELLDRFNFPYYFHSINAETMDIISPGPDGERGTPDDIHFLQEDPGVD